MINVITKSGTDQLHGSASLFARDANWQALPATYDRSSGEDPPFDRQQVAFAGETLRLSEGARVFYRSAVDLSLTEQDWQHLLEEARRRKGLM